MEIAQYIEAEIARLEAMRTDAEARRAAADLELAAIAGGLEAYRDVLREMRGEN